MPPPWGLKHVLGSQAEVYVIELCAFNLHPLFASLILGSSKPDAEQIQLQAIVDPRWQLFYSA